MEGLGGIPVGALTPAALLGLVILAIVMGRLVPRRTMEDIIHDRNEWRAAHRISEQSRMELAAMVGELLEHARTTDAFIRSLPHPHGEAPAPIRSVESAATEAAIAAITAQQQREQAGGGAPGG